MIYKNVREQVEEAIQLRTLKKQFYQFPYGCLVEISVKKQWFTIRRGDSAMTGPINKDLMNSLEKEKK